MLIGGNRLIDVGTERLRSQVAKAADCKSAIVGSTPTGASASETPAMCRHQRPSQGFFRFRPRSGRADRLQGIGRDQSLATHRLAIAIGRDREPALDSKRCQPPGMAHGFLSLALRACMGNPLHLKPAAQAREYGSPAHPLPNRIGMQCFGRSSAVPRFARASCRMRQLPPAPVGPGFPRRRESPESPGLHECGGLAWRVHRSHASVTLGSGERHHGCHCLPASSAIRRRYLGER